MRQGIGLAEPGGEQDDGREDERRRAEVEEALNDVHSKLGTEREAGLFGDQVGADGVGHAAQQRDGGEADDLRPEQRKQADFFVGLEQPGPARGAEGIAKEDAADGDADSGPVGQGNLRAKDAEVEVNAAAAPEDKRDQRSQDQQAQKQMVLLQAFSVPRFCNRRFS